MTVVPVPAVPWVDVEARGVASSAPGAPTVDCSSTLQRLVDSLVTVDGAPVNLAFRPNRVYSFTNVTMSGTSHTGHVRVAGQPKSTIFTPAGTASPMMIVNGTANSTTDFLDIYGINVNSVLDHPYDQPLILLYNLRNIDISRLTSYASGSAGMTGTGTLLKLDSSYCMTMRQCWLRTHRYAVPFEFDASRAVQCDTFHFDQCVLFTNFGPIWRSGSSTDIHGIFHSGLKVLAVNPDHRTGIEDALTAPAAAGASTITVANGAQFIVGDPVAIGCRNLLDVNKVTAIAGNVLTLQWPLRYAQPSGDPVLSKGAYAASFGDGIENVDFQNGHWEGQVTGARTGGVQNIAFRGHFNGAAEMLRLDGATQGITYEGVTCGDWPTPNVIVKVPTYNTHLPARLYGGRYEPLGSNTVTPLVDANHTLTQYELLTQVTGAWERGIHVPSGGGADVALRLYQGATSQFLKIDHSGAVGRRGSDGAPTVIDTAGAGSPEGVIKSNVGGLYRQYDGVPLASGGTGVIWYKATATVNNNTTGWVAIV